MSTDIEIYHDQARPSALLLPAEAGSSRETRVWSALPGLPGGSPGQICPASEPAGEEPPGVQDEQGEQNPQLATADVNWAPRPVPHLKRA